MENNEINSQMSALERLANRRPDATLHFIANHMKAILVTEIRGQHDIDLATNAMKEVLGDSGQSYISLIVAL